MSITVEQVAALPKVVLHDHLDGGLRPGTLLDLAARVGHRLPADGPEELAAWFHDRASAGSLVAYLDTFTHPLAVMQSAENLARVAREAVLDLAADRVLHAELRFAPELHERGGLSLPQVVDAVRAGVVEGQAEVADAGHRIDVGLLLCAMRQADRADEVAALALAHRDRGVAGFDIAGPEEGYPAGRAAAAFALLRAARFPVTVHAGEAAGTGSLDDAVDVGALRIGHGVRLADDIRTDPDGTHRLGRLAHWVRDRRIALEVCPTSNLQTGAVTSVAEHPVTLLHRLGFAVTISTDNRLQSATSPTREMLLLADHAGWSLDDLRAATLTAAEHAFVHHDKRLDLIDRVHRHQAGTTTSPFPEPTEGRHRG